MKRPRLVRLGRVKAWDGFERKQVCGDLIFFTFGDISTEKNFEAEEKKTTDLIKKRLQIDNRLKQQLQQPPKRWNKQRNAFLSNIFYFYQETDPPPIHVGPITGDINVRWRYGPRIKS